MPSRMPRKASPDDEARASLIALTLAVQPGLCRLQAARRSHLVTPATSSGASGADSAQESAYTTLVEDYRNTDLGCGWEPTGSMELRYARCFTIDYFEGGYQLACLRDGQRYLIVPEGADVPEGLAKDIMVIERPVGDVYLVASDTMCLFDALDALDRISVSGIERDDWSIPAAREAMDSGEMVYGGKYRAPDYELLVSRGVRLAIESTMINHTPDVRDKLMELGIPVLVELSSYESEPLGRAEWIRLYGALCGKDDLAGSGSRSRWTRSASIDSEPYEQDGCLLLSQQQRCGGGASSRRLRDQDDRAGGRHLFLQRPGAGHRGSSSVTMQMEQFYATAKDADIVVYNASIDDSITSLDALLRESELLADFKAVQRATCG